MKIDPILAKAARLCSARRFGEAIRLLEPEVVRYHDSFKYYYILAVSCLYSGDFGGAHTYFRRAREIKMREAPALLGLAALHLRRGETDRAIELYLEVLEKESENRIAKRALAVLKKHGDPDRLSDWLESGKFPSLFPPLPRPPSTLARSAFPALAALMLVLALSYGLALYFGLAPAPFAAAAARPGHESLALDETESASPVQVGGSYRYVLTRKQVLDSYESARRLFTDYRDEAAKVEINRILESNAAEPVKNKARLLLTYTAVPGFDTLKDRYSYRDVQKEPVLYRDVHVAWKGMAANLRAEERATSFDLLVGYDTRNALEGIVPVRLEFAATVDVERPLEVLGRLVPVQGREGFRLEGLALHQAGTLGGGGQ